MNLLSKIKLRIESSLSNKILAVFLVCLILPLMIIMQVLAIQLRATMREKEKKYVDEQISYVNAQLSRIVIDMDSIATSLLTNTNVQNGLISKTVVPTYSWFNELKTINGILSSMAAYSHFRYQISIVSADNQVYQSDPNSNQNKILRMDSPIIRHVMEGGGHSVLFNRYLEGFDDYQSITLGRPIYNGRELTGVILVEVSLQELTYFIEPFTNPNTLIYILYDDRSILYGTNGTENSALALETAQNLSRRENRITIGGAQYSAEHRDLRPIGISVHIMVLEKSIYRDSTRLITTFTAGFLVILIITMVMIILFTRVLTRNLKHLSGEMERFGNHPEPPIDLYVHSSDEVGRLSEVFYHLSQRIVQLIEQVRETEKSKRNLYIRSLWAQVNPHMVYNTLNTITYLAEVQNIENIREVSSSFAGLLHTISNKPNEFITVEEEMQFLRAYISIKKYNTLGNISIQFEVPEETKNYRILKLLLQPIVENSIIHGFKERLGENHIIISVSLISGKLEVEIRDDGNGCDEETIARLLSGELLNKGSFLQVGLHNTIERLKLQYGDDGVFEMRQNPNGGVMVRISFSAEKMEDIHNEP